MGLMIELLNLYRLTTR